jgi:hypothetical protein
MLMRLPSSRSTGSSPRGCCNHSDMAENSI